MKGKISIQALTLVLTVLWSTGCNPKKDQHTHEVVEYTCPMHPQVVRSEPGSCSICGMDLVKKNMQGTEVAITGDLKNLAKPTNSSVVASIKTVHAEKKSLTTSFEVSGIINYDTRRTFSVPGRFSGRIEKLYVKYNYQAVTKGQLIMEIYSPELVTAQRELIYLTRDLNGDKQLVQSSKQKLLLLGLNESQIENIVASGKELRTLQVFSPYGGYVVESTRASNSPQLSLELAKSIEMNSGNNPSMSQTNQAQVNEPGASLRQQISIREGMYVATGQSLFNIVDGTRLWAELYFPASQADEMRIGNAITLHTSDSDSDVPSKIDFIQPYFNDGNKFLQVRVYLSANNNSYRVGQLIKGKVDRHYKEKLWIPRQAVMDLGLQQIVFVKRSGSFIPVKVKTGVYPDSEIEILKGLDESAEVAINAQYLVDSESLIKVTNQ